MYHKYRTIFHRNPKKVFTICCALAVILMFGLNIISWSSVRLDDNAEISTRRMLLFKKDWHDYAAMESDAQRVGLGERGRPARLEDETQRQLEAKMSIENGFNALLSDYISVNRSVPDLRHVKCRNKTYLSYLPHVSIIIPFINEHFSVLVRTLYSIVNRTPPELLKEVILVDDSSVRDYLKEPLDHYVAEHFPKVHIIRLQNRTGLIGARIAGARKATGKILIFFDSHIETNYNWLPPLIEPIVLNKRVVTCPFIDVIEHQTFEYRAQYGIWRGAFDWNLDFRRIPLLPGDMKDGIEPFKRPVMEGGLFAISTEFFWELGGYDEGLDIWGGEQFELSFKIWMCGGELVDTPCSHVAHVYRGPRKVSPRPRTYDYIRRNLKRVAEVWMDDYTKYLYKRGLGIYEAIDAGDVSKQRAIRQKLQCKSFKWYIDNVAIGLLKNYPLVDPPDFAYGVIQSIADPSLCVDKLNRGLGRPAGLYPCAANLTMPSINQNWALSGYRDLRLRNRWTCLDVRVAPPNATVNMMGCHRKGGNQLWFYDVDKQWLVHGDEGYNCLEAFPADKKIYANPCKPNNKNMKWRFGALDSKEIDYFFENMNLDNDFEGQ